MEIGERIKRLRILKGMTQEELGKACDYKSGRNAISQIERGQADIPLTKLQLVANALGVSLAYLAGYETSETSKMQEEYILSLFFSLNAENRKKAEEYMETLREVQSIKA